MRYSYDDEYPSMATDNHERKEEKRTEEQIKADRDNRANQMNPNNPAYWSSRGVKRRRYLEERMLVPDL